MRIQSLAEADLNALGDMVGARPAHAQDASAIAGAFSMRISGKVVPSAIGWPQGPVSR